jgi:hypothetical protein
MLIDIIGQFDLHSQPDICFFTFHVHFACVYIYIWGGRRLRFNSVCTCVNWFKNRVIERDEEEEGR